MDYHYYLSYVSNTDTHDSNFPLDDDGNRVFPYTLLSNRCYVMNEGDPITLASGDMFIPLTRNKEDKQSVAIVASVEPLTAVDGQTLYDINDLTLLKEEHPDINYRMLSQVWVNDQLIPHIADIIT